MRKFFYRTCPKSGRILDIRQETMFHKLLYPIIGLVALGWVIIRVLPKPSGAYYPCQQAAIPVAAGFLAWLTAPTFGVMLMVLRHIWGNITRFETELPFFAADQSWLCHTFAV